MAYRRAVTSAAVCVIAWLAAPSAAWADSEPLQPLSASTTDLVALGIGIATVAVVCWLVLDRLAEARRARRRTRAGRDEP